VRLLQRPTLLLVLQLLLLLLLHVQQKLAQLRPSSFNMQRLPQLHRVLP
jgi:hypothetical protein